MNTTVSVIIPAFNQADYLASAIQSVLDQTYPAYEILVIDDGSTDRTRDVVRRFLDPSIQYVYQENRGLAAARNTGLRLATGDYISFLDADDLFLPEKIDLLVSALESHPGAGFAAGQTIAIDQRGNNLGLMTEVHGPDNPLDLILGNTLQVSSVLVRREWFGVAGIFDENLKACEDWDMWLRLIKAGCPLISEAHPVAYYRFHSAQMTRGVERMRTAMLAVLTNVYSSANIPEDWLRRKGEAYAAVYVKAAARAYLADMITQAKRDLRLAIQSDRQLLEQDGSRLADILAGWASSPWVRDPLRVLETIYQNLPEEVDVLKKHANRNLSAIALDIAFQQNRLCNPTKSRHYIWRAARYQPSRLKNRGVLSVLLHSYIGS